MTFDFNSLTIESITAGALTESLPELYRLRTIREASSWHNDDPFSQSVQLFAAVKSLPHTAPPAIEGQNGNLKALLESTVTRHSMHALLAFTTLIHDIGKADTFEQLPDGSTRCPGHEAAGAQQAPAICARFGFSARETDLITTLVRVHGEPYALHKKIAALPASRQIEQIAHFERQHAPHLRPLLLLAWGDMETSHLRTRDPKKYRAVEHFYQRWLTKLWPPTKTSDEYRMASYECTSI